MAVFLPGVYSQLQTIGGTAIGGLSRLSLTVVGRGDAKVSPINLRSVQTVPPPVGSVLSFPGFVAPGSPSATAVSGGSLADATPYFYVVTAVVNGVESVASAQVTATTASPNLEINLSWSAVVGATAYKVYRTLVSGTYVSPSFLATVTAPTVTYTDTGAVSLTSGIPPAAQTFYYVVTAVNQSGETLGSNELSISLLDNTKAVAVSWDSQTGVGIVSYRIWRSMASGSYNNKLVATVLGELTSSYTDLGTATVTATFPVANTALKVPYNTFRTFTSMTQMRQAFGSLNELGLAAQLAQSLGLNTMTALSVDFTGVDAAVGTGPKLIAKEAAYAAALEELLDHDTDIVVLLDPEPEISLVGKSHVILASDPFLHQKERALFTSGGLTDTLGDTATVGSLVYNARQSFNNSLVSSWAPVTPFMIALDDNGNAGEVALSGSYTALAAAIINALQPDEATPITNKQFSAFTRFGDNFNRGDLLILDPQGVATMTIDANGVTTIVHGVTTAVDTFEDAELNVVIQENKLLQDVRAAVQFAIGQKNSDVVRLAIHDKLAQRLQARVSQGLMTDWSGLEVLQDPARPTFVLVNFLHTPMFGVNVVLISVAFDTRSSVGA